MEAVRQRKASHKLTRPPDFEEQATRLILVLAGGGGGEPGKKMERRKKCHDATEDNVTCILSSTEIL